MSVHTQCLVLPSLYRDSVVLMQLSGTLNALPHVQQAAVMMGTPHNQEWLRAAGLLTSEGETAGANDLLICVQAEHEETVASALQQARQLCLQHQAPRDDAGETAPRTLSTALRRMPDANLACISVPGQYAGREARRALEQGLHVFLFSDHVDLDTEAELKQLASQRGLLLMGPDCGTAVIRGRPLGFANQLPSGPVGLIAASGTGLQQVSCLLAHDGIGVSQAIGVGGRDLHRNLGGHSMRAALQALSQDPDTQVIILISKPPDPEVASILAREAAATGKPCVLAFIGDHQSESHTPGLYRVATLEAAALTAAALLRGETPTASPPPLPAHLIAAARAARQALLPAQHLIYGLYCGGTLAAEALWLLRQALGEVDSNLDDSHPAAGVTRHTVLDLGAEEFTAGRPHPMIDPSGRRQRLLGMAEQSEVAVVLCDVILGWGAHDNPGVELAAAWQETQDRARALGQRLIGIATVCGTPDDPQDYAYQRHVLQEYGFILADSNAQAVRLAAQIVGVSPDAAASVDGSGRPVPPSVTPQTAISSPAMPSQLPALFHEGPRVLNLGLESFATQLHACGVPVLHIDWQPPASGDTRLANLLERLQ
ncbi:MAG: acyl-CoA synthetase FdrA [Candidatus Tectomicrobia bacterium]|nr:acyl-CoA synthetase FdrA [Candidatus Tectomicrobia bacterium]